MHVDIDIDAELERWPKYIPNAMHLSLVCYYFLSSANLTLQIHLLW